MTTVDTARTAAPVREAVARPTRIHWRHELLLAAVAVVFVASQLRFFRPGTGLGWDEAVYLSVVNPHATDAPWGAWRAWGTPLLVWPVGAFDAPAEAIRIYLAIIAGIALFGAFRVWLSVRNVIAVTLAALLFSTCYAAVLFGPQAMPNYFTALAAVAATGLFVRAMNAASVPV